MFRCTSSHAKTTTHGHVFGLFNIHGDWLPVEVAFKVSVVCRNPPCQRVLSWIIYLLGHSSLTGFTRCQSDLVPSSPLKLSVCEEQRRKGRRDGDMFCYQSQPEYSNSPGMDIKARSGHPSSSQAAQRLHWLNERTEMLSLCRRILRWRSSCSASMWLWLTLIFPRSWLSLSESPFYLKLCKRMKQQSVNYARAPRGLPRHTFWHAIDSRGDERKCCGIWLLIPGS